MAVTRLTLAALLGFVLPGFFLSRLLKSPAVFLSSFLFSTVILFHVVFWLDIAAIPLSFGAGAIVLCLMTAGFALLCRVKKSGSGFRLPESSGPLSPIEKAIFAISAFLVCFFAIRSFLSPLSGYDTFFRWNFLPQQMLLFGNFNFYPPLAAEDFKKYFYVDGIAPAAPFAYWWLYAAYGKAQPALTGIFVSIQFVLLLFVTFSLGKELGGRRAGYVSLAVLACSSLFFWSVFIGQETGLTALSLASTLYFLYSCKRTGETGSVIAAAAAAAAGALSREYGGAFILCGVVTALWLKLPRKALWQFLTISTALAAPWYVRNWIIAGNPFYSNAVGSLFSVNPVHVSILNTYGSILSFQENGWLKINIILRQLLEYAPLQLTVGMAATIILAKRVLPLTLSIFVVALLWIFSIGKTGGGYFWTLRVLSPALVLGSVCAGVYIDRVLVESKKFLVIGLLLLLAGCFAFLYDFVLPARPWTLPVSKWTQVAFEPNPVHEVWARDVAPHLQPLGCRILSDDAYAHAALYGYGIEVVPVWSPEVRFLFEQKLTDEESRARLISLNIRAVLLSRESMNNRYLTQFSFFSQDRKNWTPYLSARGTEVYLLTR